MALGMVACPASNGTNTGTSSTHLPSAVLEVPKSSPQADIISPKGVSVYTFDGGRSTAWRHCSYGGWEWLTGIERMPRSTYFPADRELGESSIRIKECFKSA